MSKQPQDERRLAEGAFLALFLLFFIAWLFYSCTPHNEHENIPSEGIELISIQDENTFLYAEVDKPNQSWITIANGNYYSYTLSEGNVTIVSDDSVKMVIYYTGMLDKTAEVIETDGKTFFKEGISKNNVFEIWK